MRKKTMILPGIIFIGAVCIGAFLSVRFVAFAELTRGYHIPLYIMLVLSCLLSVVPAVCSRRLSEWLKKNVFFKTPGSFVIVLVSLAFCVLFRHLIFNKALAGSGAAPDAATLFLSLIGASLLLSLFLSLVRSAVISCMPAVRAWLKSLNKSDFIFLAATLVVLNLFAWLYVTSSVKVYFWDTAGYWKITQMLANEARQGLLHLLATVYDSILDFDYNYLIALPGTILAMLFGPSRWVFVCGIVNIGVFPVITLLYFYIRSFCKRRILATLCLFLTFPMLFYTAIVGFVDVVGVFFILSSVLLWKSDQNQNELSRFIIIGVLLAVAVLLRRWYSFYVCAFIIALLVDSIAYRKSAVPVVGTLAALVFSLLFLFQPFVSNVLLKNVSQLYSAYQMGLAFDAHMFFNYYGLLTTAAALAAGTYFCFRREKRQLSLFLLLQAILCFLIFISVQSHNQQHLLLYTPSLMLLMSALICPLADAVTKRKTAGILLALNTLLPSLPTVYPALHPVQIEKSLSVSLTPSLTYTPPVWPDATEIVKIVRYLDEAAGSKGKTVGVLASSFILNNEILANAENSLNMPRISDVDRSYLLQLPAVDSRDAFPGALFDCDYLLVAEPIQLHLGSEKQQVVYLPAEQVLSHTGIGAAFLKTGEAFYMNDGEIEITLYEKQRELTQAEKSALIDVFNTHQGE